MLSIGKKKILYTWQISIFQFDFVFLAKAKMSSIETYGDFRVEFLHDENSKKFKENSLFNNLYNL